MVCASLNNITDLLCSSFRSIEKNQKINQNYLEAILKSIESKVENLGSITSIDLKTETKIQIENLSKTLEFTQLGDMGMNHPGDKKSLGYFMERKTSLCYKLGQPRLIIGMNMKTS